MGKGSRQVLFLQPHLISVLIDGRSSASQSWEVLNDQIPKELSAYLLANRSVVFDLLFDLAEEECHLESLPSVRGRDKKHYLERLRDKYFPSALFSMVNCSPAKKGKGVLVSGVSQSTVCEKLLDTLSGAENNVKRIHSPLSIAPQICQRLGAMKGAQLIVLRIDKSSVRLIACLDALVVLNRRVDINSSAGEAACKAALSKSLQETLVYLDRKAITGWVSPKVSLVADDIEVADVLNSSASYKLKGLSKSGTGVEIGPVLSADSFRSKEASVPVVSVPVVNAEQLLVSALAKAGRGYEQRPHSLIYMRRKVRHACFALMLSLFGGVISSAALATKVGAKTDLLSERYEQSAALANNIVGISEYDDELSVEAVRQALVTAKFAEIRAQDSPVDFLSNLSGVIENHPAVSIDEVSWERDDVLDEKSLQRVLGQQDTIDELPMELVYRATVSGAIKGSAGSALDTFEAFVNTLRRTNSDGTVVVVEAPFGLSQNDRVTATDLAESNGVFTIEVNAGAGI